MKPLVSVLIPSRQRVEFLQASVDSFRHRDVEILVAVDDDDPDLKQYKQVPYCKLFVLPRYGYENLHEYYNFLAKKSKGKWLMLGNDDGFMRTPHWTLKIAKEDHTKPQVLNVWNEQDNLFPLISRAWYNATGHFALNTHVDSWVQQTAEIIGATKYVPGIKIEHYGEELRDATHTRVREVVGQTSEAYRRMAEERQQDARNVMAYIKRRGISHENN